MISIPDDVITSRKLSWLRHLLLHFHLAKVQLIFDITVEWPVDGSMSTILSPTKFLKTSFIQRVVHFSDIDECQMKPCPDNSICQNTPGSFNCTCQPGFSGKSCSGRNYYGVLHIK